MRPYSALAIVAAALLLAACAPQETTMTITKTTYGGFVNPAYSVRELTINDTTMTLRVLSTNGTQQSERTLEISERNSSDVKRLIKAADFASLNTTYTSDPSVTDVGAVNFTLDEGGKRTTITVKPYHEDAMPPALAALDRYLNDLSKRFQEQQTQTVTLNYQPKQCQSTPWQEWYENGSIQFVKEPTQAELATAYYAEEYGVQLENFTRQESGMMACEACDVCDTSYYYQARAPMTDAQTLEGLGWNTTT